MTILHFDNPQSWFDLIDNIITKEDKDILKISANKKILEEITDVFPYSEITRISNLLESHNLSVCVYHGCRSSNPEISKSRGLETSCVRGIEKSLLNLARKDITLKKHYSEIKKAIRDNKKIKMQSRYRDGQIWFGASEKEIIEKGGVYLVFGSEYRLLILNSINEELKYALLSYGTPAIIALNVPINQLEGDLFVYKFIITNWAKIFLNYNGIVNNLAPQPPSLYTENRVSSNCFSHVTYPDRACDNYNSPAKWYNLKSPFNNKHHT